jgi:hypothetical protein
MSSFRFCAYLVVFLALNWQPLLGQQNANELAQQAANPLANLISLPFQNNTDFGVGPYDRTTNVLNIQPVVPFAGGKIVTRTIFPIVWIPDVTAESGMLSTGLSDILFTGFYVPQSGTVTWGVGPVVSIPTGGELRGMDRWGLGPSGVLLYSGSQWTLGILANNVWSIGGDSDRESSSKGLLQYFIVRQFRGGWYVNSAPILTADWKTEDDKFLIPFGVGAGKVVYLGKLPVNVQLGAYYNVVKPDAAADWQGRAQVQILLPMSLFGG